MFQDISETTFTPQMMWLFLYHESATVPIPFRPSIVMTLLSLQTHGIISPTHRSACVCLATRRGRRCSHASCWATTSLLKVLTRWIYNSHEPFSFLFMNFGNSDYKFRRLTSLNNTKVLVCSKFSN